jgi:guanosine-3',5'-bis(diphosphate) 3'-pyrophosphohydrolase
MNAIFSTIDLAQPQSDVILAMRTREVLLLPTVIALADYLRANQRQPVMREEYDFSRGKRGAVIPSPARNDISVLVSAAAFAAEKHRNQRRKDPDASPYINHPIALANVLACEAGIIDVPTIAAALLHDTVEDTDTTAEELRRLFGDEITAIVLEVTDDKSLPKADRKRLQIEHAPHLRSRAKLVKLADKICNLRDIRRTPPADWPLERRREYFDWARRVVDGLRGIHSCMEALFDAEVSSPPQGLE